MTNQTETCFSSNKWQRVQLLVGSCLLSLMAAAVLLIAMNRQTSANFEPGQATAVANSPVYQATATPMPTAEPSDTNGQTTVSETEVKPDPIIRQPVQIDHAAPLFIASGSSDLNGETISSQQIA